MASTSLSSSSKDITQDILNNNLWKLMWELSLPAIIGMSINGINAFVDALFVGQYVGQNALAAISLAFPLTFITNSFAAMIGVGTSSLLSIAIGSNDEATQKKAFSILTQLSIITSLIISVLCVYFARDMIAFMGGTGEVLDLGTIYYQIMMAFTIVRLYSVATNMIIRAEGKIKIAMIYTIASALLNMVLNYLFIGVFDWGIEGAAWATNTSMAVYMGLNLYYFASGQTSYKGSFKLYRIEKKMLYPILSVGVSAMMLQVMFLVQQIVVFRSIAYYGDDWHIAFMGATYRVLMLVAVPCFGFVQALQPIVGINFGAKNYTRVKKAFTIFTGTSTAFMLLLWFFVIFFPTTILGWMLPEATFSDTDIFNFRMMNLTIFILPLFFMGTTLFQSIGNGKVAGWFMIAREILVFVPMVLIFPLFFGVNGIYYAAIPTNVFVIVALWILVGREFRKW